MRRGANSRRGSVQVRDYLNELEAREQRTANELSALFPFWDDIQNSLIGRRLSSSSGTVAYNYAENTVDFSSGGSVTNTNDTVVWNIQLPHGTKPDSELKLHIHFEQSDAVNRTMTVRYRIQNNGQQKASAWTTVSANTDDAVWTWTTGTLNNILALATIDLTGASLSATVQFQMTRTDALTGVLPVVFADCHVERDMLGSSQEFIR